MPRSEIDLHCHSHASDGDLSPTAVVQRAFDNGVRTLALTDHDTLGGQLEAREEAAKLGLRMISGIELSCQWNGYTVHILGLNFSLEHESLWLAQEYQSQVRIERSREIVARLQKKGMPDVWEQARINAHSGVPGRPHIAQALVDAGAVKDHQEAFKKYLGAGKVGDVKSGWPELDKVVEWILEAGGAAVIAHPRKYNMSLTKLRQLIEEFKELGGAALEVVVSGQKQGELGLLADLCQRYQLEGSQGSDFHSARFPWADLGHIPGLPRGVKPVWNDWF